MMVGLCWARKLVLACHQVKSILNLRKLGERFVNKCAGVPLAIKAMGPLLQSRKNPPDWEHILTTELSDLPQDKENYILPSLRLSYNHLPSVAVKQCFAYCAIFPKDTKLDKHVLITLWMAQGFLQRTNNMTSTMEDIGEVYFAHLPHHSFLEEEEVVDEIIGTKSYKMHDLVHDLAVGVSGKDLFVWKANNQEKEVWLFDVRHLAICFGTGETTPEFPTEVTIHKIRTIGFWGGLSRWDSIISAKYIRVLIVAYFELSVIPVDIGQLIHLRYLDLSHNDITALPESLCKLYQLQTLRLEGNSGLEELPRELYKLRNLRHIHNKSDYVIDLHLSASRGLGLLTNMQTLPLLKLCDEDERWTIDELGGLNQIKGVLEIQGLEQVKDKEEARKARLGSKSGIIRLALKWGSREDSSNEMMMNIDEDVLGSLEPPPNIKDLLVMGFRGLRFPSSWIKIMVHGNLNRVVLIGCKRCKQLPTIGQLPSLKSLYLEGFCEVESIGNEFYHENTSNIVEREQDGVVFGALRWLNIEGFESLLEELTVVNAGEMMMSVARSIPQLDSLREMRIGGFKDEEEITNLVSQIKSTTTTTPHSLSPSSIRKVLLDRWPKVKKIPQQLQHILPCSTLEELRIIEFDELEQLPDWIANFSSLKSLFMYHCNKLKYLPSKQAMLLLQLTQHSYLTGDY